jgi:hypothetical protein
MRLFPFRRRGQDDAPAAGEQGQDHEPPASPPAPEPQAVEPALAGPAEPAAPVTSTASGAQQPVVQEPAPEAAEPAGELALAASEAIALIREAGRDVFEPQFLLREYERRRTQGEAAEETRRRLDEVIGARLRRIGALAEGQPLRLELD